MYAYIKGSLEEAFEDHIVVDNNGIGYNIYIPARMFEMLPAYGQSIKVYTYFQVREDAHILYGFPSYDEQSMFRLLITVNGIGPKAALSILSVLSPNDIRFAVASDDAKTIAKAPGIGAKTAQRVVMELKDKVDLNEALEQLGQGTASESPSASNQVKKEAAEALIALGYSSADASRVLSDIEVTEQSDVESVLKSALRQMAFL